MSGTAGPHWGRRRPLITPEGIALTVTLADPGERVAAFILDLVILTAAVLVLTVASLFVGRTLGSQFAWVMWLLGFFLLRNFYWAFFELTPRAATPGKRALRLRVVARDGGRLAADSILARNLVREFELFLPLTVLVMAQARFHGWMILLGLGWTGLFLVLPLLNRDRLRVGDILAGTWVVQAPRRQLLRDLAVPDPAGLAFTKAQLGTYGITELHALEEILRYRRDKIMTAVAGRIRAKIGWQPGTETDEAFLVAYYAGLRGELERGLLFGRRRRDKFDRG